MAARQGFTLVKSRRRDPKAIDYAGFSLIDPEKGAILVGNDLRMHSATIDQIEEWLTSVPRIVRYATGKNSG